MGDVSLPEEVSSVLRKGPKYSLEPVFPTHELLALNRRVAERAQQEDKRRCTAEGVEVLERTVRRPPERGFCRAGKVVELCRSNGLRLLQSDKEGGFVVLPEGVFAEKAGRAVEKNFHQVQVCDSRVRKKAAALCESFELQHLAKAVKISKSGTLAMFFTAKTHKPEVPFRTIVSEKGTWQLHVSRFLLKDLRELDLGDPFAVRSSGEVIGLLEELPSVGYLFSVDVVDLFYSVPHQELFRAVRDCIEVNGLIAFQNASGLAVDNSMTLLEFYLGATVVQHEDRLFLQRRGICIGSCVAPVLCDIFLSEVDRGVRSVLDDGSVLSICRYVDDFLVVVGRRADDCYENIVSVVLQHFDCGGKGLSFTSELQANGRIQFLDLNIRVGENRLCWAYHPRAKEDLLPFDSAQSKTVKRAIALLCLESALKKSCEHVMLESFAAQVDRLSAASFPARVLASVAEGLLQKVKGKSIAQFEKSG
ncbi:uncharacterized protein LOC135384457 [Ornithodoros turicata]|uniref:uncharacterized protein LOC135384457 n=1 Tax=Ornithodoros turicata TaxID=34597 RepID=UPI0031395245